MWLASETNNPLRKSQVYRFFCGIIAAWVLVVLCFFLTPGAQALLNGELLPPNPLTCDPGTCFDKALKHGYPRCTGGTNQMVRGVLIPQGKFTCYKSIEFNLEMNSAIVFLVFFIFCSTVARIIEYLITLFFEENLRMSILFPLVAEYFPCYYSWNMVFTYLNEFMHPMFWSQSFFTATEMCILANLIYLADRRNPVHARLINIAAGLALFHFVQALLDEFSRFFQLRNLLFLTSDLAVFLYFRSFKGRKFWRQAVGTSLAAFLVFQLFFADLASWTFFRILHSI